MAYRSAAPVNGVKNFISLWQPVQLNLKPQPSAAATIDSYVNFKKETGINFLITVKTKDNTS